MFACMIYMGRFLVAVILSLVSYISLTREITLEVYLYWAILLGLCWFFWGAKSRHDLELRITDV